MSDLIAPGIAFGLMLLLVTLQLGATVSLYLSARKYARELSDYPSDQAPDPDAVNFEWLKWLMQRLKTANLRREAITRETATSELDSILLNQNALVILHKTAIVAPLVGVIVTAMGFFFFEFPANPQSATTVESSDAVFSAIRPLAWGVFLGALLAIFNQCLLYLVGTWMARLRQTARLWLEQRQDVRGEFVDTATAGLVLSQSVEAVTMLQRTAAQHNDYARQLQRGVDQLAQATQGIQPTVRTMSELVNDLQTTVGLWHDVTQKTQTLIESSAPQLAQASTGLDFLVRRFHETFDERLFPALERQASLSSAFGNLLENVESVSQKLGSASGQLVDASQSCVVAWNGFQASWQEQVVPAQTSFHDSVNRLDTASLALSQRIDLLSGTMGSVNLKLTELAPEMKVPLNVLREVTGALKEAVEVHLTKSLRTQEDAAANWLAAATAIGLAATELTGGANRSTEAANSQAATAHTLEQLLATSVVPAWTKLQQSAANLQGVTTQLATNVEQCGVMLAGATTKLESIPQATSESFANLKVAVGGFATAVSGNFSQAAQKHASIAANLELAVNQITAGQQQLLEQAETLVSTLGRQNDLLESTAGTQQALGSSAQNVAASSEKLQQCVRQQLSPSSMAVAEAITSLQKSIESLNHQAVLHLRPASELAAEFQKSVVQLGATIESLRPLTHVQENFRQLADSIDKISYAVQAINLLPERLEQQRNGKSMLGFLTPRWWKSRLNEAAKSDLPSKPPGTST